MAFHTDKTYLYFAQAFKDAHLSCWGSPFSYGTMDRITDLILKSCLQLRETNICGMNIPAEYRATLQNP